MGFSGSMKRLLYLFIGLILIAALMAPATLRLDARADLGAFGMGELSAQQAGAVRFAVYDWGGLNAATLRTSGVPWKLAEAVLALNAAGGDVTAAIAMSDEDLFRPFGFQVPDRIANWPDGVPLPDLDGPFGVVRGQTRGVTPASVEIANTGCGACHSAPVYRADGTPDVGQVWMGGANASLNLEAYTGALFEAFLTFGDTAKLRQVLRGRFPDISLRERATLRLLLPALMRELHARDGRMGRLFPFVPSHIGATNGYDALRLRLGLIDQNDPATQPYFTSIPAVGGRDWRRNFLSNGVYSLPDIEPTATTLPEDRDDDLRRAQANVVSYFIVPSMGVTAQVAIEQQRAAQDVMAWIAQLTPQPYPAAIDRARATAGQDIYAVHCAECHGSYDASLTRPALTSFPNWEGDVGTYLGPPLALIQEVAVAVNTSEYAPYLVVRPARVRSAVPLTGLWASAPYLANGSVPTLWHLMRPDARPRQFAIGGHALDMDRVGIDLDAPDGYVPWASTGVIDTTQEGFSNVGHVAPFEDLNEAQKDALLEYLKLL